MLLSGGSICGRLTQNFALGCLQDGGSRVAPKGSGLLFYMYSNARSLSVSRTLFLSWRETGLFSRGARRVTGDAPSPVQQGLERVRRLQDPHRLRRKQVRCCLLPERGPRDVTRGNRVRQGKFLLKRSNITSKTESRRVTADAPPPCRRDSSASAGSKTPTGSTGNRCGVPFCPSVTRGT